MSAPDVSVVVAVYNTMPYLTTCLTSLVEQSIGRNRMEIIAVDDGSTDGSGAELDRFAEAYPGTVIVIHQPNSGGPAAPSNLALEKASGRYVYFVGADDHLGREALERLVTAADEFDSDVVLGRMVGVNGRLWSQAVYDSTRREIGLFDSKLPYALSNTKLFRRSLIEQHGLRFPVDWPMCSDQPFTLAACLRARRISVLADYEYYYAVRRTDSSNITYRAGQTENLRAAERLMDFVAGLIEPGPERDAVLLRHFNWEVGKLLRDDFVGRDRAEQEHLVTGVRALAERYLTDGIRERLGLDKRLRISLAQYGDVDDVIRHIEAVGRGYPPLIADGEHYYAGYPAFRDQRLALPDAWFDVTERAARWLTPFIATSVEWERVGGVRTLAVTARSTQPDPAVFTEVALTAWRDLRAPAEVTGGPDGTEIRARFPVGDLLTDAATRKRVRRIRVQVTAAGRTSSAWLRMPRGAGAGRALVLRGLTVYLVTPFRNKDEQLAIATTPVTRARVVNTLRGRFGRRGQKS